LYHNKSKKYLKQQKIKIMKTTTFISAILTILLPVLVNAQCLTVNLQSRDFNGYQVSCQGANDGSLIATVQGSGSSYSYLWSNGSTASVVNGLAEGTYSVTVSDNNGCSEVASMLLAAPSQLTINAYTLINDTGFDILCNGDNSGVAVVDALGGAGSYHYAWSSGDVTQTISGLGGGSYDVTVSDLNGCMVQSSVQIIEPTAINLSAVVKLKSNGNHLSALGANDGEVIAAANGGMGFYTFEWSNGHIGDTLTNVGPGVYTVTVTDMHGCSKVVSATVENPRFFTVSTNPGSSIGTNNNGSNGRRGQLRPVMPQLVTPNTAGFNSNFTVKNIENVENVELTIFNMMGQQLISYKNYSNEWNGVNANNEELTNGTYVAVMKYTMDGVTEVMTTQVVIAR
jgi:gliding motility-associated-like protein